ncbi:hypothetical protein D3C85_1431340 [compost metagenome]
MTSILVLQGTSLSVEEVQSSLINHQVAFLQRGRLINGFEINVSRDLVSRIVNQNSWSNIYIMCSLVSKV